MPIPLLSVCLITYNHEKYIAQAIEGVLMQEVNFPWELIIADDCSTDGTIEVLLDYKKKHPDFIKLVLQKNNVGPAKNWMDLLLTPNLETKYIAYFEGDDYWTDSLKLQKQVGFLEENPDYVMCFHKINILTKGNEIVDDFVTKVPEKHETLEDLARLGNYIHTPSVVFRNIIKEFPFEFRYSPIGDYFLYIMLAEHGKIKYIKEVMAIYRYGVGILSSVSVIKLTKNNIMLFSSILSYLKNDRIKQIFIKRQIESINHLEYLINDKYRQSFVSNKLFFKVIKTIQEDYGNPVKIVRKVRNKILKKRNEK